MFGIVNIHVAIVIKKKNEKNEGKVQYCSFSFLRPRVIVLIDWEMSILVVFAITYEPYCLIMLFKS